MEQFRSIKLQQRPAACFGRTTRASLGSAHAAPGPAVEAASWPDAMRRRSVQVLMPVRSAAWE